MDKRRLIIIASFVLALIIAVILFKFKANIASSVKRGNTPSQVALLNQAQGLEAKGELMDVRAIFQKLASEFPNSPEIMNWQKKIEELNIKLLFSPLITSRSTTYEIKPGDNLTKIAKDFKTTVELLKRSNNISDDKILPGRKIKVWRAPFSILVDKSQNILILKTDEDVFKTYTVSTGNNNSTPIGNFKIVDKLENPTWFKTGAVVPAGSPENILGSRWLGLSIPGYGIHGTTDPESLGQQVTQGCVRMSNSEVEELYAIVPVGTEVSIID